MNNWIKTLCAGEHQVAVMNVVGDDENAPFEVRLYAMFDGNLICQTSGYDKKRDADTAFQEADQARVEQWVNQMKDFFN